MNYDEFSFFNQQLAGMLRSGIPLEGALAQLSRGMRKGKLKAEVEELERDLREGVQFDQALKRRNLPKTYVHMLTAGLQAQSLPAVLILVADYYSRIHNLSTRMRGLMVYPAVILACSLALSLFFSISYWMAVTGVTDTGMTFPRNASGAVLTFWTPSIVFFTALLILLFVLASKRCRHWLRWKIPGMADASIAQSASTMAALLRSGARLETALQLVEETESNSPGGRDIARWRENAQNGLSKFPDMAQQSRAYPPLFVWLVAQYREDLAKGFQRAAELYHERAKNRTDLLLYAALPMAVVVMGMMVLGQTFSMVALLRQFMSYLGL